MFVNNVKPYRDIPSIKNFNHVLQDLKFLNSAAEISMINYALPL